MGTNSTETSGTALKTAGGLLKIIGLVLLTYVVGVSIYALFQYDTTKSKLLTYGLTDATASLVATAAMLIALGLPSFAVFRIVTYRGRVLDYAAALALPLLSWGIAQLPANFDARTGEALKYCVTRPDGSLFCLDRPGIDPLTQKQLAPISQSLAELQFRKDRGLVPKRITGSPSEIVFFDPLTAQPKVWVLKNDQGCYDMFDNPGAHPQTGEQLQPVTKDIVRLINQCTKRDDSNLPPITKSPASAPPMTAASPKIGPSFDCRKAETGAEKIVCASSKLSILDLQLSNAYREVIFRTPTEQQRALRALQNTWLRKIRDSCQSETCLTAEYTKRIRDLESQYR